MKSIIQSFLHVAAILFLLASLLTLTSCTESGASTTSLAIVTLNGRNAPACEPATMSEYITAAASTDGSSVSLIIADGEPFLSETISFGPRKSKNDYHWDLELTERCAQVEKVILESSPKEEETDVIGAIRLASRQLQSEGTNQSSILVIAHSGLNTTSPFPMQSSDLTSLDTDDMVAQLEEAGYLADLDGCDVHWYFLGDVDGNQDPLESAQVESLHRFWSSYLEQSGAASVTFHSDLPTTGEIDVAPEVSTIEVEPVELDLTSPISLDSEIVHFLPDSAQLSDEASTIQQLSPIAEALKASPNTQYILAGSTADVDGVTLEHAKAFSLSRAVTVKSLLCDLGVPSQQLLCIGLGDAPTSVRSSTDQTANRTVWLVPAEDPLADEFTSVGMVGASEP